MSADEQRSTLRVALDAVVWMGLDIVMASAVIVAMLGAINWLEYGW